MMMFQCPLVTTCFFFKNKNWGAEFYKVPDDDLVEHEVINCSKCLILNDEQYQEMIKRMLTNGRSSFDIFFYLNYLLNKEGGAESHG